MSAIVYNSKPLASRMINELSQEAVRFREQHQRPALLVQLMVGNDDAAGVYSRQLKRACQSIGLDCVTRNYPFNTTEEELQRAISTLNDEVHYDGIVLLLPLPAHIRQQVVTDALSPEKDVDGLGPRNAGNMMLGFPNFVPSTADAVLAVLQDADISVDGCNAVIVGRSNIGGKPVALALMSKGATVTICHSYTEELAEITRSADILVVSVGRAGMIKASMVKPGAIVLDAGINTVDGRVVGDVELEQVKDVASFITPVPGGLGPLTHLTLLRHTLLGPR